MVFQLCIKRTESMLCTSWFKYSANVEWQCRKTSPNHNHTSVTTHRYLALSAGALARNKLDGSADSMNNNDVVASCWVCIFQVRHGAPTVCIVFILTNWIHYTAIYETLSIMKYIHQISNDIIYIYVYFCVLLITQIYVHRVRLIVEQIAGERYNYFKPKMYPVKGPHSSCFLQIKGWL